MCGWLAGYACIDHCIPCFLHNAQTNPCMLLAQAVCGLYQASRQTCLQRLLFQAYVSYKVRTKTTLQHFRNQNPEVIRRFRDFAWLQQRLQEQNKGAVLLC